MPLCVHAISIIYETNNNSLSAILEDLNSGDASIIPDPDKLARGPVAYISKERNPSDLEPVCRFIGKYVKYLHGENTIKKFVDREKGRTFLDMITPSDVAYSISLIKNSQDVWKESNKISKMPEEVQKKYKDKKNEDFVKKEEPLFTKGSGQKREFGRVMWNEVGTDFLANAQKEWIKSFNQEEVCTLLEKAWESYTKETNDVAAKHWREEKTNKGSEVAPINVAVLDMGAQEKLVGFMKRKGNDTSSSSTTPSCIDEITKIVAENVGGKKKKRKSTTVTGPRRTPSTRHAKVSRKKSGAEEEDI